LRCGSTLIGWPWCREAKNECARLQAALDKKRSKLKAKGKDKKELKRSLEVWRTPAAWPRARACSSGAGSRACSSGRTPRARAGMRMA
jgi:hypothetical protein